MTFSGSILSDPGDKANFTPVTCPICLKRISRCGLANHIRSHIQAGECEPRDGSGARSREWWDGWMVGYTRGIRDGRREAEKRFFPDEKMVG